MNRERHKYWASYIADLQGRMLLAHWNIDLVRKPCTSHGCAAHTNFAGPCHEAWITFGEGWEDHSRRVQRHVVVHELVHLHMHPMETHLGEQRTPNKDVALTLRNAHRSHEEYAVDDLARIIAPSMPLPPRVKA